MTESFKRKVLRRQAIPPLVGVRGPPPLSARGFVLEGSRFKRLEDVRNPTQPQTSMSHYGGSLEKSSKSVLTRSSSSTMSLDHVKDTLGLEEWLDTHPEFLQDYFNRKATRSMIDNWLISHSLNKSAAESTAHTTTPTTTSPTNACATGEPNTSPHGSKHSSGANTPVRKISAQEFEKGGQILKPMISTTADGQVTFLSSSTNVSDNGGSSSINIPSGSLDSSSVKSPTSTGLRKTKSELKALDEREIMYELVMDICNDLDVTSLCHKILQNVSILLNADRCSLFLVEKTTEDKRVLVSKLFDVNSNSTIEECTGKCEEIRVPWGKGIAGHVAQSAKTLNIPDAYKDTRFNPDIDIKTGYTTQNILCMPIFDMEGEVLGVAQAINKIAPHREQTFTDKDEKVFSSYLAFCGIGLRNAQLYEKSLLENRRSQLMLDLARVIFEEQTNVANLIHKIMMHTQSLLRCERCQVMLVDPTYKGVFSQVFDLQASDFDNNDTYHREGTQEPRFPLNIGISGYVAATGETLNIPDVRKDDRFDPKSGDTDGFVTRCILCMPIKNVNHSVIGVAQFVNKLNDRTPFFSKTDENLFEAFAIFCGMGINNTQMYEKACKAMAKQQVALECLSYHSSASEEEVSRIKQIPVTAADYGLYDFAFNDSLLDDDGTLKASIRMFQELNLTQTFNINHEVLCRFLLSVKKNYRNVTYHNWRHAFNVAQSMFCMLTIGEMKGSLTDEEILALIVGCLCHDLDHRGTNNQYQIKTMSPLATLYSTSTMEHHHFDQCIMILNTKGNDILCNINEEQYSSIIKLLENAILATDLALYFKFRGEFIKTVNSGGCDWNGEDDRDLLRAMMMTACDVSAITKPWPIQKSVAEMIYNEFFEQGDLEKQHLKIKPMDIMDRDKKDELPAMQVGFIDGICLPVYEAFEKLNTKLSPLANGCRSNRENWQKLSNSKKLRKTSTASNKSQTTNS